MGVRLCAIPVVRLASLALAAVLFSIPADQARAHDVSTATHHAAALPLHEAARAGDLDSVNHFITVHMADVNRANASGVTPLHSAADGGHVAIVSLLIKATASLNVQNDEDDTPLHLAVQGGHAAVVAALLAAGASVNLTANEGQAPLHLAADAGQVGIVSLLIKATASLNVQNDEEKTPLHLAIEDGYAVIVAALIVAGADVSVKDKDKMTPLHRAVLHGHADLVAALLAAGADVDPKNKVSETPLHIAAGIGRFDIIALLLAAGADVNAKTNKGETPLNRSIGGTSATLIATGGHWGTDCGSVLVTNPAGPDPPCLCESPYAGTPANCGAPNAERCGLLDPAQFYDAAADACVPFVKCAAPGEVLYPEANDCHAESSQPLHDAARAGDLDSVNHFITVHMADVNRISAGTAPLHWAANRGHAAVVSALLAAGASVNVKDNIDSTPLHFAADGGYVAIVSMLVAEGADMDAQNNIDAAPLHYAASSGHAAVVSLLLAEGADVDAKDEDDETSLHWAARNSHAAAVDALLAGGADVIAKNKDDKTPLHLAVEGGHASVVAALIAAGAYWGEAACGSVLVTNPAGPAPPCLCESPHAGTPANCGAPNAERCGLLDPAQFYDAAADACVPFVKCAAPGEVLYPEANDCHAESSQPLHDAARAGDLDLVNHFITVHMADVNRASAGAAPLHWAATGGHAAVASALLAAGASVNVQDNIDATPLHFAADGGHAAVVSVLLAAGASVNVENNIDATPLHFAASGGYVTVAALLLVAKAVVDAKDEDDQTSLHWAARNGRAFAAALLLAEGADVDAKDEDDETPLHLAADRGQASVVSVLVAEEAEVNATNKGGETPLRVAAAGDHAAVVALLLAEGGHWGTVCGSGEVANPAGPAPPCVACNAPSVANSETNRCDCPAPNIGRDGEPAPGDCAVPSKESCTRHRFYDAEAGACVPLATCSEPGEILHFDMNDCHPVNRENPLREAARLGDLDLVNHFITAHMADVNKYAIHPVSLWMTLAVFGAESDGVFAFSAPLHWAAFRGHVAVVSTLLAAGADADARGSRPSSPLHLAVLSGHVSVVSVLLAAGANVDAKNNSNKVTPLHLAAKDGYVSVVSALVAEGAEVNAKNTGGETPMRMAADGGHTAVVSLLLAAGGHWGTVCGSGEVLNLAGPAPPCLACNAPSVGNPETNLCDCPAPNIGTDGEPAPGKCTALSTEYCGELTPAKFYDSAADACVTISKCTAPAVFNAETNLCDCPAVGTDGAAAPGDCVCPAGQGVLADETCGVCPDIQQVVDGVCQCPAGSASVDVDALAGFSSSLIKCYPQKIADMAHICSERGYSPTLGEYSAIERHVCVVPTKDAAKDIVDESGDAGQCWFDETARAQPACTNVFGPDFALPQNPEDGSDPRYIFNCDPNGISGLLPATINTIGATRCACPAGEGMQDGICAPCLAGQGILSGNTCGVCPAGEGVLVDKSCGACPAGEGVLADKSCGACPNGQGILFDGTCGVCAGGTSLVDDICTCPGGQGILDDGMCGVCPVGESVVGVICSCDNDDLILVDGVCRSLRETLEEGLVAAVQNPSPNLAAVRALLDRGARADVTTSAGTPILIVAATLGHAEIVSVLVTAGADATVRLNINGVSGRGVSHIAVINGFTSSSRSLYYSWETALSVLRHFADAANQVGATYDWTAQDSSDLRAVEHLRWRYIQNDPATGAVWPGESQTEKNTAMVKMASILLANGDSCRLWPSHITCQGASNALLAEVQKARGVADVSVVVKYLNIEADPDVEDQAGRSALIVAARNGHAEIVSVLITAGADANAVDTGFSNFNVAHHAAAPLPSANAGYDYAAGPRALRASVLYHFGGGLDVRSAMFGDANFEWNHMQRGGKSILDLLERAEDGFLSAPGENLDIIYQMADYVIARGETCHSAVYNPRICAGSAHIMSVRASLLVAEVKKPRGVAKVAEVLRLLGEDGSDPNIEDSDGAPILIVAATIGHAEIVSVLVTAGADATVRLNINGVSGRGVPHIAAVNGFAPYPLYYSWETALNVLRHFADAVNQSGATYNWTAPDGNDFRAVEHLRWRYMQNDPATGAVWPGESQAEKNAAMVRMANILLANGDSCRSANVPEPSHVTCEGASNALLAEVQKARGVADVSVVVKYLNIEADPDVEDSDGTPILIVAATLGHADIVSVLVTAGADADARRNINGVSGRGVPHIAVINGFTSSSRSLYYSWETALNILRHFADAVNQTADATYDWAALDGNDFRAVEHLRWRYIQNDPTTGAVWPGESQAEKNTAMVKMANILLANGDSCRSASVPEPSHITCEGPSNALLAEVQKARGVADVSVVLRHLNTEADPNTADQIGRSALIWASRNGHAEIVSVLITAGADPTATDPSFFDVNAAQHAATHLRAVAVGPRSLRASVLYHFGGGLDVRKAMFGDANFDWNYTQRNGRSILDVLALAENSLDAAGEDVDIIYEMADYMFSRGARCGSVTTDKTTRRICAGNARISDARASLLAEVKNPRAKVAEVLRLLDEDGAGPNIEDSDGAPILIVAATLGHAEIVSVLVTAGADADARRNINGVSGRGVSHIAAVNGFPPYPLYYSWETALNVLRHFADAVNQSGATYNWTALDGNDFRAVEHLLYRYNAGDAIADGESVAEKETAMARMANLLLAQGDSCRSNFSGLSHITCQGSSNALLAEVQKARGVADVSVVVKHLNIEADPDAADRAGRSALIVAARNGHAEIVSVLATAGADVNAADPVFHGFGVAHHLAAPLGGANAGVAAGPRALRASVLYHFGGGLKVRGALSGGADYDWNREDANGRRPLDLLALAEDESPRPAGENVSVIHQMADYMLARKASCGDMTTDKTRQICAAIAEIADARASLLAEVKKPREVAKVAEVLRLLDEVGVVPNIEDSDGTPILIVAATIGHAEIVSVLVTAGANPNARLSVNKTTRRAVPHVLAVNNFVSGSGPQYYSWGTALNVLRHFADAVDQAGATYDWASPAGQLRAVENLRYRYNHSGAVWPGESKEKKKAAMVRMADIMLANGDFCASGPYVDASHITCQGSAGSLLAEVQKGPGVADVSAVVGHLNSGADPDIADSSGRPALIVAARNGHAKIVSVLATAGADVSATDPVFRGFGAAHHAASPLSGADAGGAAGPRALRASVLYYFGGGLDVRNAAFADANFNWNRKDTNGRRPLDVLVLAEDESPQPAGENVSVIHQMADYMLVRGASCSGATTDRTRRACAGSARISDARTSLLEEVKKPRDVAKVAEVLRLLDEDGAGPDIEDPEGTPILIVAATIGHAKIVSVLVTAGANPDARLLFPICGGGSIGRAVPHVTALNDFGSALYYSWGTALNVLRHFADGVNQVGASYDWNADGVALDCAAETRAIDFLQPRYDDNSATLPEESIDAKRTAIGRMAGVLIANGSSCENQGNKDHVTCVGPPSIVTVEYGENPPDQSGGTLTAFVPSGGATQYGARSTFTAVPAHGWELSAWEGDVGDCVASDLECVLTANDDLRVTAFFERAPRARHAAEFDPSDQIGGSVTVSGTDGEENGVDFVYSGRTVTFTATPVNGWEVSLWAGDASTCRSSDRKCEVVADRDLWVTVLFKRAPRARHAAEFDPPDQIGGSVTVSGTDGFAEGEAFVYSGGTVTFTAIPENGWEVSAWEGGAGCPPSDWECVLTANDDLRVTAHFSQAPRIEYAPDPSDERGGRVTISGTDGFAEGEAFVYSGGTVTFTAIPADGWERAAWTGDCAGVADNACAVAATLDVSVGATFTDINECQAKTHNCAAVGGFCDNIDSSFTCSCVAGYSGDGVTCDADKTISFQSPVNGTLSAAGAGVSIQSGGTAAHGTTITFAVEPAYGHRLSVWFDDCAGVFDLSCKVVATVNVSVGVIFTDINECQTGAHDCAADGGRCINTRGIFDCVCDPGYSGNGRTCDADKTVSFQQSANGTLSATGAGGAIQNGEKTTHGTPLTFTAKPNKGYQVSIWLGDCAGAETAGAGTSCTVDATLNISVGVTFNDINECEDVNTHDCAPVGGECGNTQGAYTCSCLSGYSGDGRTCDADKTVSFQPSANGALLATTSAGVSVLDGGTAAHGTAITFTAAPDSGYQVSAWFGACAGTTGDSCEVDAIMNVSVGVGFSDINECEDVNTHDCAPVGGECVNTEGAYTCSCLSGYSGDGRTCDADKTVSFQPPANGALLATTSAGVSVLDGGTAAHGTAITFTAAPDSGYQVSAWFGACAGTTGDSCEVDAIMNVSVRVGFSDINECEDVNTHDCAPVGGECGNTQGAYTCSCLSGYSGDGRTCDADKTVSFQPSANGALLATTSAGVSVLDGGTAAHGTAITFTAAPDSGYQVSAWFGACAGTTGDSCEVDAIMNVSVRVGFSDINECEDVNTHDCAPVGGECVNTEGAYTCSCLSGYSGDGRTCDADKTVSFQPPANGALLATTSAGVSVLDGGTAAHGTAITFTAAPDSGYQVSAWFGACAGTTGNPCEVDAIMNVSVRVGFSDINECEDVNTHDCAPVGGECGNTQGAYTCSCLSGYSGDGRTCDADKTVSFQPPANGALLATTSAGVSVLDGGTAAHGTAITFTAAPNTGYQVSAWFGACAGTTGDSCEVDAIMNVSVRVGFSDINECEDVNTHDCAPVGGECGNTQGAYTCSCLSGYSGDGRTCDADIIVSFRQPDRGTLSAESAGVPIRDGDTAAHGATIIFTATPDAAYQLSMWSGACAGASTVSSSCEAVATLDVSVGVAFAFIGRCATPGHLLFGIGGNPTNIRCAPPTICPADYGADDCLPKDASSLPGAANDPNLCEGVFGGRMQTAGGSQAVCSKIDRNDTFCIVGSQIAFPCQGLFKHVWKCNMHNRPALNPFFCGASCEGGTNMVRGRECGKETITIEETMDNPQ